jgi:type II secretory pathway pseudopilin PulG
MIRKTIIVILWLGVAALLASLLLPSVTGIPRNGDQTKSDNTAYNLKNAISAYFTEYRQYPGGNTPQGPDVDLDSGHVLMDILLGSDKEAENGGGNLRRIAFYTDKAAKPLGEGKFRKGVVLEQDGRGTLWDPWGNFYRVRMDSSFDNKVENPELPGAYLPESILIWSAGKDGDFDTWKDNLKTW